MKKADLSKAWTSVASQAGARGAVCAGRIVANAGHDDSDPGSVNSRYGLHRREQALDVVGRLQTPLEAYGRAACMTSAGYRRAYANTIGARVLVPAHTSTLFGGRRKEEGPVHSVYEGSLARPAAVAGAVFVTGDAEKRLSNGARQQQTAAASKTGTGGCLAGR